MLLHMNEKFTMGNWNHLFCRRIFPIELEIKDTTDTDRSASCLYMPLPTPRNWQVKNETLRQKRWFQFPIVNFSFICSNIPAAPVYEVYVSQLIWYSRTCGSYQDFLHRGLLLIRKLRNQVEVITSKVLRLPPWLGWPLWNICVTTDHGYVPLVGKHFLVLSNEKFTMVNWNHLFCRKVSFLTCQFRGVGKGI
jgi:hypothetical protein